LEQWISEFALVAYLMPLEFFEFSGQVILLGAVSDIFLAVNAFSDTSSSTLGVFRFDSCVLLLLRW
jgi:hypothetical protein